MNYARKVYRRDRIAKAARKRLKVLTTCQHSAKASRNTKRALRRFRHQRRERRERLAWTPYQCGSHGRSAIPCYIVECETGGTWSWTITSPGGHYGRYQLATCWWSSPPSPAEQNRIAARLWAGGAGAGNWACA